MDDNLTDQQQAELIKNWLKENSKFLMGGLVLGISGFFGIQFFQQNKLKEAEMASQLYSEIEFAVKQQRLTQAQTYLQEMDTDFANTPYQDQGHLFVAKLFMDSVDYENAILQLEFLIDNSTEESLKHIARIRIARIKLQQNLYDEALQILETESMGSFEAKYEEIKGDIFAKKGEYPEAQAAYLKALDLLLPGQFDYEYIQMKFKDIQSDDLKDTKDSKDGNA